MKKEIICPTCGGHVEEFDHLDTIVEDTKVSLFKIGECDHCGNHYQWFEEFTFARSVEMEQIEREDEPEDYGPDLEMGFDPYMGCYSDDC